MGGVATMVEQPRTVLRPCPDDFVPIFVLKGRLACEEHYRVGRLTIDRWLDESGKDRLIEARRVYVRGYQDRAELCALFIAKLAASGNVITACREVPIPSGTVYKWRAIDAAFARAWDDALEAHGRLTRGNVAVILSRAFQMKGRR